MLKTFQVFLRTNAVNPGVSLAKYSSGKPAGEKKKIAVILSGSGVYDGSEIHEASATVVHLTRKKYQPCFYAPDVAQMHVINHAKGEPAANETRCVLAESARIARGQIQPLSELCTANIDAAVFPGGFGVAKNLSDFATSGPDCTLNVDICKLIKELHECKKPMAFMCISPILAARTIPCVKVTLGSKGDKEKWPHSDAIDAATKMGAQVENQDVTGVCIDKENLVVSTPAFMYNGEFYEVFDGIGKLIDFLDKLLNEKKC